MKLTEITIFTDSIGETAAFYLRLLRVVPLKLAEDFALFESAGVQFLIRKSCPLKKGEPPPENHLAFESSDLDADIEALQSGGYRIQYPPRDYEWGRAACMRDPVGNLVELKGNA